MFAFIALLFVLMTIYFFTSNTEGFTECSSYIVIPKNVTITPAPSSGPNSEPSSGPNHRPSSEPSSEPNHRPSSRPSPSELPGQLPVAPYEQVAAMSPLPYQDTKLIKANFQQLVNLLELLKGFLSFEAQEISESSDPSIQLPLTTARSDFHTLQRETEVLNRNPGIQSTITLSHLNEIGSNVAYLQSKVRLTGSGGKLQGPIYEFTKEIEGFADASLDLKKPATINDLYDFIEKIDNAIKALNPDGTNDIVTLRMIQNFTNVKNDVQNIIYKMKNNQEYEILTKGDIDNSLPTLYDSNENLPINKNNGHSKNRYKSDWLSELMDKYGEELINGVNASIQISYTSPNESTIDRTGFPSMSDLNNTCNVLNGLNGLNRQNGQNGLNGQNRQNRQNGSITYDLGSNPTDAGRGPSHFDWKTRAIDIENQIKKRGLNPKDFGVLTDKKVSDNFSWKGYTRMMCTRLQATTDTSLPETCGCPPMNWPGWRIAR